MEAFPRNESLESRMEFLRSIPLFAELNDHDLKIVLNDMRPREYERQEIVFWQDENSQDLFIVRAGKVRIFKISPSGNETSIVIFSTGDVIGEMALLDQQPRSATAKAMGPCILWRIAASTFIKHLREMHDLCMGMNKLLATKLRWTASYAETIAQYDSAGRLLHILMLYNQRYGIPLKAGNSYELDLALTQDDLASLVGVSRESINRLLQLWKRQKLLEYKGGKIILLDLEKVTEERDRRIEGNDIKF